MFVNTKIVIDIETGAVLEREGYGYDGDVELCCGGGPSASQQDIAASQKDFYHTLSANYAQMFSGQTNILNSLQASFKPILDAGINQYGFSPAEDANFRSQATEGVARNFAMANKTAGQEMAAQGGGNTFLPSGANAQISSQIATTAAGQQSSEQLGITEAGYAQGRANYLTAAQGLGSTASMMNPTGYAGQANTSGNDAFGSATTIYKENQAANPWGAIGGLLGGAAGAFLGPMGASIGSNIGSSLGGSFGGNSQSSMMTGDWATADQ